MLMDISPNALRKEVVKTLREVEEVIDAIVEKAESQGADPAEFVDMHGTPSLSVPLLAKAQCLQTLVLLNEKR